MTNMPEKHFAVDSRGSNQLWRRIMEWYLLCTIMEKREKMAMTLATNATIAMCESMSSKAGIREEDEWKHAGSRDEAGDSVLKPPCSGKRPYFQIRWGFQLSSDWHPPPRAGLRGRLDWMSMSGLQMPHAGHHPHILLTPFQPGQEPRRKVNKD